MRSTALVAAMMGLAALGAAEAQAQSYYGYPQSRYQAAPRRGIVAPTLGAIGNTMGTIVRAPFNALGIGSSCRGRTWSRPSGAVYPATRYPVSDPVRQYPVRYPATRYPVVPNYRSSRPAAPGAGFFSVDDHLPSAPVYTSPRQYETPVRPDPSRGFPSRPVTSPDPQRLSPFYD